MDQPHPTPPSPLAPQSHSLLTDRFGWRPLAADAGHVRERATDLFVRTFGTRPISCGHAPGRVNIIGDHTDYAGGSAAPMAIQLRTAVVAKLTNDGMVSVVTEWAGHEVPAGSRSYSRAWKDITPAAFAGPNVTKTWAAYAVGAAACAAQTGWLRKCGLQLALASDIPVGAGLSSSAALEVATIGACVGLSKLNPTISRVPELAQRAEHLYAGVPCGIMDQLICTLGSPGGLILINFATGKKLDVSVAPDLAFVVAHSGVSHNLVATAYADRRAKIESALQIICRGTGRKYPTLMQAINRISDVDLVDADDPEAVPLVAHVLAESRLTRDFCVSISDGDAAAAGAYMTESHESLKKDYKVSCPELDAMMEFACALPGVHGARMSGGGFGGCIVALCDDEACGAVEHALRTGGRSPLVFRAVPSEGLEVETLNA